MIRLVHFEGVSMYMAIEHANNYLKNNPSHKWLHTNAFCIGVISYIVLTVEVV